MWKIKSLTPLNIHGSFFFFLISVFTRARISVSGKYFLCPQTIYAKARNTKELENTAHTGCKTLGMQWHLLQVHLFCLKFYNVDSTLLYSSKCTLSPISFNLSITIPFSQNKQCSLLTPTSHLIIFSHI